MNRQTAEKLLNLRNSPHFAGLVEYLNAEISRVQAGLEVEEIPLHLNRLQGEISAYRSVLRDFDDLEQFVQNRDNSSESPDSKEF